MSLKPLRRWGPGEPVDHTKLNELVDRAITDITVGPDLIMQRVGGSVAIGLAKRTQAQTTSVLRVLITQTLVTGDTTGTLMMVREWDGGSFVGAAFAAKRANGFIINHETYVTKPRNGIIGDPTYDDGVAEEEVPVEWMEVLVAARVKLDSIISIGKYVGALVDPPIVDIPNTGDLTAAEVGAVSAHVVRVVNAAEEGAPQNFIDPTGTPNIFPAQFLRMANDGAPVYLIDTDQSYDCDNPA